MTGGGPKSGIRPPSVAVLGAGTMGAGMALAFSRGGSAVSLVTRRQETLDRARSYLEEGADVLVGHGVVSPEERDHVLGRITATTDFDAVDFAVDLVEETVVEDLQLKRGVLGRAEQLASPQTILATNTSSLPLTGLSSALERPENFAGLHWFNPPELVELVEVVSGPRSDERTLDQLMTWATGIGKRPVLLRTEIEGFVANRLQYALIREAYSLVASGVCTVADVDRAVKAGLGPRWAAVGPFESMDLAGLDVHQSVAGRLFPTLSNDTIPPAILDQLVREGALGVKTGRGLCGEYDEVGVQRITERRAAVLLGLAGGDDP